MNKDTFSFIIYMIHKLADSWEVLPGKVYALLKGSDCIDGYLVPHYDVLHTLSSDYLVEDIEKYLEKRGVVI